MSCLHLTLFNRIPFSRLPRTSLLRALPTIPTPSQSPILLPRRRYASKSKARSTASIIPGSKQPITDEAAQQEYAKAEKVMSTSVNWFRQECAGYELRANGRVTPDILSPVQVKIPGDDSVYHLEKIATVGVREGTTLLISLFDENNIKHVESALYTCNIPGVVPHRHDSRTIKVTFPKPTVESRLALYTAAKRKAEEIRTQVRKQHSLSLKKGKYKSHSVEIEEFQKLTNRYIGEIDEVLKGLQQATGASK